MVETTAKITVNSQAVSMAAAIRTAAESAPLVTLTGRALADLARELGGQIPAARFLADLATQTARPISINFETDASSSSMVLISPHGWSQARLSRWVAKHRAEFEREFGQVVAKSEAAS